MIPDAAIIDSDLMLSVPPDVTAYTGMDALTQVLESFLSSRSNILIDTLCEKALPLALEALPIVFADGQNAEAREKMAYVSLIGGIALANAGLGAVHGFAAAIGGMFDAPHGLICACFLPVVFEANYLAILKKKPKDPILAKFRWFASLCGNKSGEVIDAIETLYDLRFRLNIPGMRKFGMDRSMVGEIAQAAAKTSSMKGNPVELSREQLMEIYLKCV
jgi:alcohol dehydrogenase class IV